MERARRIKADRRQAKNQAIEDLNTAEEGLLTPDVGTIGRFLRQPDRILFTSLASKEPKDWTIQYKPRRIYRHYIQAVQIEAHGRFVMAQLVPAAA